MGKVVYTEKRYRRSIYVGWSEAWHANQGKHEVGGKERLRNRNNF